MSGYCCIALRDIAIASTFYIERYEYRSFSLKKKGSVYYFIIAVVVDSRGLSENLIGMYLPHMLPAHINRA